MSSNLLDFSKANPRQGGASWSLSHRIFRLFWNVAWALLASWTPALFYGWRRFLLRAFGARISSSARIYPSARIWYPPNLIMEDYSTIGSGVICYNVDIVHLEPYAIVSERSYLCPGSHDIDDPSFQLRSRPIRIGRNAWVAVEAFVGPGVTIGEGAVLGARGVASKDMQPWGVYAGNPAKYIRQRKQHISSQ